MVVKIECVAPNHEEVDFVMCVFEACMYVGGGGSQKWTCQLIFLTNSTLWMYFDYAILIINKIKFLMKSHTSGSDSGFELKGNPIAFKETICMTYTEDSDILQVMHT